jgi:hypothetical protein
MPVDDETELSGAVIELLAKAPVRRLPDASDTR